MPREWNVRRRGIDGIAVQQEHGVDGSREHFVGELGESVRAGMDESFRGIGHCLSHVAKLLV